jgi:hypothetical protein
VTRTLVTGGEGFLGSHLVPRRYPTDLLWLVPYAFARWESDLPPELRASLLDRSRRTLA